MQYVIAYVGAAVVFGALDAVWLGWAGSKLYRPALGNLLADQFRLAPALVFYVLYLAGIIWFAVRPGLAQGLGAAALNGAILGAMCYMTYDPHQSGRARALAGACDGDRRHLGHVRHDCGRHRSNVGRAQVCGLGLAWSAPHR